MQLREQTRPLGGAEAVDELLGSLRGAELLPGVGTRAGSHPAARCSRRRSQVASGRLEESPEAAELQHGDGSDSRPPGNVSASVLKEICARS